MEITVLDISYWVNIAWQEKGAACITVIGTVRNVLGCVDSDSDAEDDDIPLAQLACAETVYRCNP